MYAYNFALRSHNSNRPTCLRIAVAGHKLLGFGDIRRYLKDRGQESTLLPKTCDIRCLKQLLSYYETLTVAFNPIWTQLEATGAVTLVTALKVSAD